MSKQLVSIFVILLVGLKCLPCAAQEPTAPFLNKTEIALIVADSAGRTMDWVSTEKGLDKGFKEVRLPSALVNSKLGFALYEAGIVSGVTSASYLAYRNHHRKLGWMLQAAEMVTVTFAVKHNYNVIK